LIPERDIVVVGILSAGRRYVFILSTRKYEDESGSNVHRNREEDEDIHQSRNRNPAFDRILPRRRHFGVEKVDEIGDIVHDCCAWRAIEEKGGGSVTIIRRVRRTTVCYLK
jgi:hypothetical protein